MNQITTCPHCSKRLRVSEQITDKTLICPHCLANVDNPRPGAQIKAPDLNTDVKRDVNGGCILLAVLMGLCFLGIIMAMGDKDFGGLFISGAALLVLVCIAIIRGRVRRGNSGGTVGIAILVLGTIVAIAIFGFFCCAAGVGESLRHMH